MQTTINNKLLELIQMQAERNDARIPFYVFNIEQLKSHVKKIKEIAGDIPIYFSVKSNPMLIGSVDFLVDGFEVSSAGELEICKKLQVNAEKISFTGVMKTKDDIQEALDYGVQIVSIESKNQLEILKYVLKSDFPGKQIDIMLRLTTNNQLGMDEDAIRDIIRSYSTLKDEGITIKGIHYFRGTQAKIEKTFEDIKYVAAFVGQLTKDFGIELDFIEYGTGMRVDYFNSKEQTDIYTELKKLILQIHETGKKFRLEFGRFMVAYCGYYVARVIDIKKNNCNKYVILNGGKGHFTYYGSNNGMRVPNILHIREKQILDSDDSNESWALCGPICNDVIVRSIRLNEVNLNDIFVFPDLGAYSILESMFLFLSRRLPEVYFYENENMCCVRHSIKSSEINCMMLGVPSFSIFSNIAL